MTFDANYILCPNEKCCTTCGSRKFAYGTTCLASYPQGTQNNAGIYKTIIADNMLLVFSRAASLEITLSNKDPTTSIQRDLLLHELMMLKSYESPKPLWLVLTLQHPVRLSLSSLIPFASLLSSPLKPFL